MLRVAGADLVDGTPIFDIKPYLPYSDIRRHEATVSPAAAPGADTVLEVVFPPGLLERVPQRKSGRR
ncbi:MAG: TrmO family methyltransferase [Oscillospiraceae bacterium]